MLNAHLGCVLGATKNLVPVADRFVESCGDKCGGGGWLDSPGVVGGCGDPDLGSLGVLHPHFHLHLVDRGGSWVGSVRCLDFP